MQEIITKSKTLEMLDSLNIKYIVKNNIASLVDHDSLTIQLTGKYAESWKRWSTGDYGRNHIDLLIYLNKIGQISNEEIDKINKEDLSGKKIAVKRVEKYNYKEEVTNPNTWKIKKYLTNKRFLSNEIVDLFIRGNKIVQDGRDNLRFHFSDLITDQIIGAEIRGLEKVNGKTLRYIATGSEGYFYIKTSDFIQNIVILEAPIDLMSYYELERLSDDVQENSFYNFPIKRPNTLYFSLSGSGSKIERAVQHLEIAKIINPNVNIIVATDNDEAGGSVYNFFKSNKYSTYNLIRELPNKGDYYYENSIPKIIKDWNDLLKIFKEED